MRDRCWTRAVGFALLAMSTVTVGCNKRAKYEAVATEEGPTIAQVSAFKPLLDVKSTDPPYVLIAADVAGQTLLEITDRFKWWTDEKDFTPRVHIAAELNKLGGGCKVYEHESDDDAAKRRQECLKLFSGLEQALTDLAGEAAAVAVPAESMPRIDPTKAPASTKSAVDAIVAAIRGPGALSARDALWIDPKATPAALDQACKASQSDWPEGGPRFGVTLPRLEDAAQAIHERRGRFAAGECLLLTALTISDSTRCVTLQRAVAADSARTDAKFRTENGIMIMPNGQRIPAALAFDEDVGGTPRYPRRDAHG